MKISAAPSGGGTVTEAEAKGFVLSRLLLQAGSKAARRRAGASLRGDLAFMSRD
jgi:hypothetical protein